MSWQRLEISYQRLASSSALAEEEASLLEEAMVATELAHAPYSGLQVGCALRLASGEVLRGNNQENPAFPAGMCAERTALFAAGAAGKASGIRMLALRARHESVPLTTPLMPCGGCLQVMATYERMSGQAWILLFQGQSGEIWRMEGVEKCLFPFYPEVDLGN